MWESYWSEVGDSNGNYCISKGDRLWWECSQFVLSIRQQVRIHGYRCQGVDGNFESFLQSSQGNRKQNQQLRVSTGEVLEDRIESEGIKYEIVFQESEIYFDCWSALRTHLRLLL